MKSSLPFLKPRYSITDLSESLDIPVYQLSAFFNRVAGHSFNDYINQLRVRYCIDLMLRSDVNTMNMQGLAFECGFYNRNSFCDAFKKNTGYTPAFYLKKLHCSPEHERKAG